MTLQFRPFDGRRLTPYRPSINGTLFVSGGPDPEIALAYVQDLFMKRKPENKKVYLHVTCATDTDLMRTVLKDVFEILVDINLKKLATL